MTFERGMQHGMPEGSTRSRLGHPVVDGWLHPGYLHFSGMIETNIPLSIPGKGFIMKALLVALCVAGLASAQFDFEYNTSGTIGLLPTYVGSSDGWAEYFIVPVQNTTGQALAIKEFRFPCCGPTTSAYGWVVWTGLTGMVPPSGDPTTAGYYGSFTPAIPTGGVAGDITEYTIVDVSAAGIVIPAGGYWCFGYDNTMLGGQIASNGVVTYGWYEGVWDPDDSWGRTDLLEFAADYVTALNSATWAEIKTQF